MGNILIFLFNYVILDINSFKICNVNKIILLWFFYFCMYVVCSKVSNFYDGKDSVWLGLVLCKGCIIIVSSVLN